MQVWLLHGTSEYQGLTHGSCSSSLCCQVFQWHASDPGHCLAWSGASHSRGTKAHRGHTSGMSVPATILSEVLLVSEIWSTLRDNQITCASRQCWNAVHTATGCCLQSCHKNVKRLYRIQSASLIPSSYCFGCSALWLWQVFQASQNCCPSLDDVPDLFNPKTVIVIQIRPLNSGIQTQKSPIKTYSYVGVMF